MLTTMGLVNWAALNYVEGMLRVDKIKKQELHKLVTSRFKGMYGRGAESVKIDISDNIVEIEVTFGLNHIEKQLLNVPGGKALIIEAREHIFNSHLDRNIDYFSNLMKRRIVDFSICRDMELRISRLTIVTGEELK